MTQPGPEQGQPVPLSDVAPAPGETRMVDGVPVRTYRGASLAELAPRIRAELGDSAMILRQREGVTGGIAGFFAKRTVEVDVAVLNVPGSGHIDTTDGPSVGPAADAAPAAPATPPTPTTSFAAIAQQHGLPATPGAGEAPAPPPSSATPASREQPPAGPAPGASPYLTAPPGPAAAPSFTVGAPSAQDAAGIKSALRADQARQAAEWQRASAQPAPPQAAAPQEPPAPPTPHPAAPPTPEPAPTEAAVPPHAFQPLAFPEAEPAEVPEPPVAAHAPATSPPPYDPASNEEAFDAPFDAGQRGAAAAPHSAGSGTFEDALRTAGLDSAPNPITDPVAELTPLHAALLRRGLPDQIASPVTDDTLCHRVPLQPDRAARELLVSELARRIPTAPLAGRTGQAVAFVGSSGAGKTRAIARLAAAYGAAGRVPVACVTLGPAGDDGLLAGALAPYGIAVHSAPDAPRALERITALRRHALVLVDTPGVSPGDRHALGRLGATLDLLELDQVALCLPVVLAAPIARRVLRAMRPLGPTMLVATHADEADLLGGVVAVAIDRRVPLAYVSSGAGRGSIAGADATELASALIGPEQHTSSEAARPADLSAAQRAARSIDRDRDVSRPLAGEPDATEPTGPSVDVAAGPSHIAAPWIVGTPLRERRPRRK